MEKLSEEERERIEKESKTFSEKQGVGYPVSMDYRMMIVSQIKDAYKSGATSECFKKNKEIERLREAMERSLQNGTEIIEEAQSKLQASKQRVKELEGIIIDVYELIYRKAQLKNLAYTKK